MSPPTRRRSSRLRGASATPGKSNNHTASHLLSLAERDETATSDNELTMNSIPASLIPRTPTTAGRIKPAREEMHPSLAHQSTTQAPSSGFRLGFTDIHVSADDDIPSGVTQQTPTKLGISSPSFDFRFARPGPQLGPEAQRMMDGLREEALRIKAKLAAEREEEARKAAELSDGVQPRKIAQPKGKAGRFSDVHMAQFKKMDSIAGHPSSFRAQPPRTTPVAKSLKRTQSKAQLDDREEISKKSELSSDMGAQSERLENTAPAKRARKFLADDASSARPTSSYGMKPAASFTAIPQQQPNPFATLSTPTQASLARATSTTKVATQIPSLSRSPSKPNLTGQYRGLSHKPSTNELATTSSQAVSSTIQQSPSKLDRVKSILRHPSSSIKKSMQMPTTVPSSIPKLSRSPSKPNLNKSLPSVPTTPVRSGMGKVSKHVNFTPDTINKHAIAQNSPSPMKSGIPRSTSKLQLGPKVSAAHANLSKSGTADVQYPSISDLPSQIKQTKEVEYPSLAGVRPLPLPSRKVLSELAAPPSVPGTFTFRSDHTINFGTSPKGFGSSPGQSSVRKVRQSIFPGTMPGTFPSGNKENTAPLPAVPHGMTNKKRRRVESDDETEEEVERSPKKHKVAAAEGSLLMAPNLQSPNKSRVASPAKKKGVLSLSRLAMLARPKVRK